MNAHGRIETADSLAASVIEGILTMPTAQVPRSALERVSLLLLDTVGVCIAASPMEAGRLARETAFRLYNTASTEDRAHILFDGRTASIAGAAFAAASQIDNLDAHDGYNPAKGHIGCALVPSLIALSEQIPDLKGPDAMAALVLGYEFAGRAAEALHGTASDYHTSGAWNALGVAAMGARLHGLDAETLRHAQGIAEYHGPRSQMMREIANPTMLHDGSGQGALVGLSALVMAQMGFAGAPAVTLEAPEAALYWADFGQSWLTEEQYIKPYPVCRWAHSPMDAALDLRQTHTVAPHAIKRVEIRSFRNALKLFPGMPETSSQAQYSLAFAVAVMLVHGRIGLEHISGEGLRDPDVARLVAVTDLVEEPRHEAVFPRQRLAAVSLCLKDGTVLDSGDVSPRGGPDRPFGEAEITAKFDAFAGPVIGEKRARAIRESCLSLNVGDGSFADFANHLFMPPE